MNLFKTFVITILVILVAVGCYIFGYWNGARFTMRNSLAYNIGCNEMYLLIMDEKPEKLRSRIEEILSSLIPSIKDNPTYYKAIPNLLMAKPLIDQTRMEGWKEYISQYISKHPTNSLSKEVIDFAKSQ